MQIYDWLGTKVKVSWKMQYFVKDCAMQTGCTIEEGECRVWEGWNHCTLGRWDSGKPTPKGQKGRKAKDEFGLVLAGVVCTDTLVTAEKIFWRGANRSKAGGFFVLMQVTWRTLRVSTFVLQLFAAPLGGCESSSQQNWSIWREYILNLRQEHVSKGTFGVYKFHVKASKLNFFKTG